MLVRLPLLVAFIIATSSIAPGQGSGRLSGTARVASGAPVPNVQVVVTNQVNGKWKRTHTNSEGKYSFQLPVGAYRLRLSPPHLAKFETGKDYGEFSIAKGDTLENVIVEAGKDIVVDIPLDQVELKEIPKPANQRPTSRLVMPETKPFLLNRKQIQHAAKHAIAGASVFLNTIATVIGQPEVETFRLRAVVGGILTTRAS